MRWVGKVEEWIVTISHRAINPPVNLERRLLQLPRSRPANLKPWCMWKIQAQASWCMPSKGVAIYQRGRLHQSRNET